MKTYRGRLVGMYDSLVEVVEDGRVTMLQHHVHHSPDGYAWGYGGSGPSELAKDLLWDLQGKEPHPRIYHAFKNDVVARWPKDGPWVLSEAQIFEWLGKYSMQHVEN